MVRFPVVGTAREREEILREVALDRAERDARLERFRARPREEEPVGIAGREDDAPVGVAHHDAPEVHGFLDAGTDDAREGDGTAHGASLRAQQTAFSAA